MSSSFARGFSVSYFETPADNRSSGSYTHQKPMIETSSRRYVSQLQDWNRCDDTTAVSRRELYAAGPISVPERVSTSFPAPSADQFSLLCEDITTPANFLATMERMEVTNRSVIPFYSQTPLYTDRTNDTLSHNSNDEAALDEAWSDGIGYVYGQAQDTVVPQFDDDFDPNLSNPVMRRSVSQPSMSSYAKSDQTQYVPDQYNTSNALCPPRTLPHSRSSPSYGQLRQTRVLPPSPVKLHMPPMGPPPSIASPMAPVPMTLMQDTSTTFVPINAQVGSTEPFWFIQQNHSISRASQSHQLPPAPGSISYPGDAIPYVYPGDPTLQMAHPKIHHPKKSSASHVTRPKLKSSTSVVSKNPIEPQGFQRGPAYLDVWQPPPSYSNMQLQRRRMHRHIPKWEFLNTPWLTCPWQHLGCSFSHKVKAQMTRHISSCRYNPNPVLQKCEKCDDAAYTRIDRLFEHYQKCTHRRPQENQ